MSVADSTEMSPSASVTVVGGVYRERVRHPPRVELFGSGGRAAATIASLGVGTLLQTAIDDASRNDFEAIAAALGFQVEAVSVSATTEFIYDHPLGPPRTRPMFGSVRLPDEFAASAENALVFGMVEGDPRVTANRLVYDPQNPLSPQWLEDTGSSAAEIVYVLNRHEGQSLTGQREPEAILRAVLERPGVRGCALKLGPLGALIGMRDGSRRSVPCYETPEVWPVGSGDVFAATLAWAWLAKGLDVLSAGEAASRGAALYVATVAIPTDSNVILGQAPMPYPALVPRTSARAAEYDVYLAGPFFSLQDQWLVEEVRDVLLGFGLRVFSPLHDVGPGEALEVAPKDLEALSKSHAVLALLDRLDPGTLFEVGFARAEGIPVVAHVHGISPGHLKMIQGSGCLVTEDLSSALYHAAWTVLAE